jgi:hypothetical protein
VCSRSIHPATSTSIILVDTLYRWHAHPNPRHTAPDVPPFVWRLRPCLVMLNKQDNTCVKLPLGQGMAAVIPWFLVDTLRYTCFLWRIGLVICRKDSIWESYACFSAKTTSYEKQRLHTKNKDYAHRFTYLLLHKR